MRTAIYYKVQPSVAERAGVADIRYRTADGMMILNEQDIRMTRLEPMEYLTGVVEAVLTEEEALLLIEQGGRLMGLPEVVTDEEAADEAVEESVEEPDEAEAADEENDEDAVEPVEEEVTNE